MSQHSHGVSVLSGRKIFWVTLLNAVITAAEIAGGLLSGSLALLSDAVHNFSDTVAIALSYFANRIAQKPQNARSHFPTLPTESHRNPKMPGKPMAI